MQNLELVNALEIFHSKLKKKALAYGDIDKIISKKYDQNVTNKLGLEKKAEKYDALL